MWKGQRVITFKASFMEVNSQRKVDLGFGYQLNHYKSGYSNKNPETLRLMLQNCKLIQFFSTHTATSMS